MELVRIVEEILYPENKKRHFKGEVEKYSPSDKYDKLLFSFDESLRRLRDAGFTRHLRPGEYFSVLLNPKYSEVSKDMLRGELGIPNRSTGEWLSAAMLRRNNQLLVMLDPENIVYDNKNLTYVIHSDDKVKCLETYVFDVSGLPSKRRLPLEDVNKISPELIVLLFGRKFSQLPREVQREGGIVFPEEGVIIPVHRGANSVEYRFVVGGTERDAAASRGVKLDYT